MNLTIFKAEAVEVYPGYLVTREGKVFSRKSGKWLKPQEYVKGYSSFALRIEGETINHLAHRLVAMAYIPNPNGLPLVCHKDDDRGNNEVSNLYWGTKGSNLEDAYRNGKKFTTKEQLVKMQEARWPK